MGSRKDSRENQRPLRSPLLLALPSLPSNLLLGYHEAENSPHDRRRRRTRHHGVLERKQPPGSRERKPDVFARSAAVTHEEGPPPFPCTWLINYRHGPLSRARSEEKSPSDVPDRKTSRTGGTELNVKRRKKKVENLVKRYRCIYMFMYQSK